jgi:type IV pilus assembly protein PilF
MKIKIVLIVFLCFLFAFCASSQTKIDKLKEENPQYQYNRGSSYLNVGQLDLAINHLSANALGLAYFIKGDHEESEKFYQRCLAINPTFSEAHNNLGNLYQEMGLLEKAEEEYLKATMDAQYSSRELPYYNLGRLYFSQNKIEDALFQVRNSLEIEENFLLALNLEGQIYVKMNRLENAIESFEKARKLRPDDIDVNFNLAETYFKTGRLKEAKDLFGSIYSKTADAEMKKKIENYLKQIK